MKTKVTAKQFHGFLLGTGTIIGIFVWAGCATNRDAEVSPIAGHWECYERTGYNSLGMRNTVTPGDPEWYDESLDISANGKVSIPPRGIMDEIHGRIRPHASEPNRYILKVHIPWAGGLSANATATYNEKNGSLTLESGKNVGQYTKNKTKHDNKDPTARPQGIRYFQKQNDTYLAIGKIGGGASSHDCAAYIIQPQYVDFPMLSEEERRTIAEESGKQLMAEIDKADKEGRIFSLTDEQLLKFSKQCWPKTDPESIIQWRRQHLAEPKR